MSEPVYDYRLEEEPRYEIIGGEKIYMAASPNPNHVTISSRIFSIFEHYFDVNNISGGIFVECDVHLPEENHVLIPDVSIVRDLNIVLRDKAIYGVPDLVVEILSPSTANNDLGAKKDAYERNGVKEYWIVNHVDKSVQVYHLIEGKFKLDYVYHIYTDQELSMLEDYERDAIKYGIKVSIFDDFIVDVADVFYDI